VPATPAPALTRAELRRRAQSGETSSEAAVDAVIAAAPPLTRRSARTRVEPVIEHLEIDEIPVEELPDLSPEALLIPEVPVNEPVAAESRDDPFETAARLFDFTGETPVQVAANALADPPDTAPAEPRRRAFGIKRLVTTSFSIGVVGVVGLLTVGMTTPLEAVAAAQGAPASISFLGGNVEPSQSGRDIQAYVAPAEVQGTAIERDEEYETTTIAQLAAESGISNFSNLFVNNPNSPIQWPFAVGVPISYGFGMRPGGMHEGLDFTPGEGAPVQAIADGTVRIATESGGAYGVTVVIDHEIDGELVSSRYGHMQYGSLQVEQGQHVTVGTFIGRTGDTGRSFGAHTHVEILQNGTTPIDPLPWFREHAGG